MVPDGTDMTVQGCERDHPVRDRDETSRKCFGAENICSAIDRRIMNEGSLKTVSSTRSLHRIVKEGSLKTISSTRSLHTNV